jgi:coiled-coil and C2 domain-containing protein 2A
VKIGEDHGILLCNYFNFIDKIEGRRDYESLLVICKAFPYGKCIFVLRRDKATKNCEIWDPYKGECYYMPAKEYEVFCCFIKYEKQQESVEKAKDICPIIEVSCLVSRDNVYFNLQDELKLPGVDLNIEDENLWKPFLSERTRNELFEKGVIETIQTPVNPEFYPDYHRIQSNLETDLNKYIRECLEKERRNHFKPYTFKINDRITNIILNRLMPLCEAFKVDNRVMGGESRLYSERERANFEESVAKIQE